MNSCILMAEIIQEPQLRYTSDNQSQITELLVQFPGPRPEDPPATLKVVGWGNLAQEIFERYHPGDRVVIEGRLNMNTIERPEGFKEKRAELTASRIHSVGTDALKSSAPPTSSGVPSNVVPLSSRSQASGASRSVDPTPKPTSSTTVHPFPTANTQTTPPPDPVRTNPVYNEPDASDDIPF